MAAPGGSIAGDSGNLAPSRNGAIAGDEPSATPPARRRRRQGKRRPTAHTVGDWWCWLIFGSDQIEPGHVWHSAPDGWREGTTLQGVALGRWSLERADEQEFHTLYERILAQRVSKVGGSLVQHGQVASLRGRSAFVQCLCVCCLFARGSLLKLQGQSR